MRLAMRDDGDVAFPKQNGLERRTVDDRDPAGAAVDRVIFYRVLRTQLHRIGDLP